METKQNGGAYLF